MRLPPKAVLPALALLTLPLFADTFSFTASQSAEIVADIELSSTGSDWSKPGGEAAVAELQAGGAPFHIMLHAGARRFTYTVLLGRFPAGTRELSVRRHAEYSAPEAQLQIHGVRFRELRPGDPDYLLFAHAPVLQARPNTVGKFTDIPLLLFAERLLEDGKPLLQYSAIFSNEDGGTSTRALMARWGRATDIEYVYKVWLDGSRATYQGEDHKELPFTGPREDLHPLFSVSTHNNMVAPGAASPVRYRLAPVLVDLTRSSREDVMDRYPFTWQVMAQELEREGKIRPFGTVDGEKIGDPRTYLYFDAQASNRQTAIAVLVRLQGENVWRSSHLGRPDYAISRDGWFRTTVELPPETPAGRIAEFGFECLELPNGPASTCRLESLKAFFAGGAPVFSLKEIAVPSGQMRTLPAR
jgi:hypothetical protein